MPAAPASLTLWSLLLCLLVRLGNFPGLVQRMFVKAGKVSVGAVSKARYWVWLLALLLSPLRITVRQQPATPPVSREGKSFREWPMGCSASTCNSKMLAPSLPTTAPLGEPEAQSLDDDITALKCESVSSPGLLPPDRGDIL